MTTGNDYMGIEECPAESMLRLLSGKWKLRIIGLATRTPLRFNSLLRQLPQANKQSISVALKELEEGGILTKTIVQQKPLHIEYALTDKGRSIIPVFRKLDDAAQA